MGSRTRHILAAAVLLLVLPVAVLTAKQGLVIRNDDLDLPVQMEETTLTNAFIVYNPGDEPIGITRVRPTCGCTFARAETNTVHPGAEVRILFAYKAGRNGGPQKKQVILFTSETQKNQYRMKFTAHVETYFKKPVNSINLGTIPAGSMKKIDGQFVFTVHESCSDVRVGKITVNPEVVKAEAAFDKQTRRIVMKYTFNPENYMKEDPPREKVRLNIVIELFCDNKQRNFTVPVLATIE